MCERGKGRERERDIVNEFIVIKCEMYMYVFN